jgi:hypothetical protein
MIAVDRITPRMFNLLLPAFHNGLLHIHAQAGNKFFSKPESKATLSGPSLINTVTKTGRHEMGYRRYRRFSRTVIRPAIEPNFTGTIENPAFGPAINPSSKPVVRLSIGHIGLEGGKCRRPVSIPLFKRQGL